ncbi:hypothetical protein Sjap_009425 [Stephania japonica]|uniref:Uncharacterized protein n=1 Tax=Stephania japonica TaxID=461633 RepID=A0AAP0JRC5_9MAGN
MESSPTSLDFQSIKQSTNVFSPPLSNPKYTSPNVCIHMVVYETQFFLSEI